MAALQAAACALLRAGQHDEADRILASGELLLVGAPESWAMGSRVVAADRLVLVLEPPEFIAARADSALIEQIRDALAQAMHSEQTRLGALDCCLRLPLVAEPWRAVYRTAPRLADEAAPAPGQVMAAARAVLSAAGDERTARLLDHCTLELAELPRASGAPTARKKLRCVLLVPAEQLALIRGDRDRLAAVRGAIIDAATRPLVAVVDVSVGLLAPE